MSEIRRDHGFWKMGGWANDHSWPFYVVSLQSSALATVGKKRTSTSRKFGRKPGLIGRAFPYRGDYEATLTASTKNLGDCVEIRIRDNGTGITPDVKEKMFEPSSQLSRRERAPALASRSVTT
jgi:hypothetical protein